MKINMAKCSQLLLEADNILILSHRRPDGDTIGSAFGLYYSLTDMGKTVRVECSDPFPAQFSYFYPDQMAEFTPDFVVAVDTADVGLLGDKQEQYGNSVNVVIDHHKSNSFYGEHTLLDVEAPATTELVYLLLREMGAPISKECANSLLTGLITDTNGFRYPSVTPRSHTVAAQLMEYGADNGKINQVIYESISRGRLKVEAFARNTMEYYLDNRCALLYLPKSILEETGAEEDELDGISSLPRMIAGVSVGITIRETEPQVFRVSLRSIPPVDSSEICKLFGGGGHANAGGCTMRGNLPEAKKALIDAVEQQLKQAAI